MKYIFRGLVVFDYDEERKDLTVPVGTISNTPNLNMCKFIEDDYGLMRDFMDRIRMHQCGVPCDLNDVEVD